MLRRPAAVRYTQLTDLADSAGAPALSPDGHILAFLMGGDDFLTAGAIYVKMLPNGEAKRVTDDHRSKYGLAFSPDGSKIAYTVLEPPGPAFDTYEVSSLGGEPQLLKKNAAGLVWLDPERLLFSEIKPGAGLHLGVVTASVTRSEQHDIYLPAHQRGMAHYSYPSPDRRSALVVEMDENGGWAQCKLIDVNGQHPPTAVGTKGACRYAEWSPNGEWMYFTAYVEGRSHIWRQHLSSGTPEQITFGPTEEQGIAVEPNGRALITAAGVHQSTIWIQDGNSQRQLSSEGEVIGLPIFSPDSSVLYYLLRHGESNDVELRRTRVDSGKGETVLPGVAISEFDLSPDGKQVMYETKMEQQVSLWVAAAHRSSSPIKLGAFSNVQLPHFGDHSQILLVRSAGNADYLEELNPDGLHFSKVFPNPIGDFLGVSPGRHWAIVNSAGASENARFGVIAIPLHGGAPRRICADFCWTKWSPDGRFLFVPVEDSSPANPGRSLAIPIGPDEALPNLSAGGIMPLADPGIVRGARSVARADLIPGKDKTHFAWVNSSTHLNLYRVSLP